MYWRMIVDVCTTVRETMQKINIKGEMHFDIPLSSLTTIRTGGPAAAAVYPRLFRDITELIPRLREAGIPYTVMGAGSNILADDAGYPGCIIDMKHMNRMTVRGLYVCAEAGIRLEQAIRRTTALMLSGLEYLSGIPGTIGGAVACNAGSFGQEICSLIDWVDYIDAEGYLRRFHRGDAPFAYRCSPFQTSDIIVETALRMTPGKTSEIVSRISRARSEREKRGHYSYPSAGSVFRNPDGIEITAGELIEQIGLKGYAVGGAQVSKKHGNIIINTGSATTGEIKKLIDFVRSRVQEETGILLEREIVYLE